LPAMGAAQEEKNKKAKYFFSYFIKTNNKY
jgi:hypothetical protein